MEEDFYELAMAGRASEMEELLKKYCAIDVNWKTTDFETALHHACREGHDSVVAILLAHPDIHVNQTTYHGRTPFLVACAEGKTSCVRLLLKDSRVKVNKGSNGREYTPLWWAAHGGHLDIVKWWMASGREMDLGIPNNWESDVLEIARRRNKTNVAALLDKYVKNPTGTRSALKLELCCHEDLAAEMFALVVFVSDGLLRVSLSTTTAVVKDMHTASSARFFYVATRLPLELQTVLCYRLIGSAKDIIQGRASEVAFKHLAKLILRS